MFLGGIDGPMDRGLGPPVNLVLDPTAYDHLAVTKMLTDLTDFTAKWLFWG